MDSLIWILIKVFSVTESTYFFESVCQLNDLSIIKSNCVPKVADNSLPCGNMLENTKIVMLSLLNMQAIILTLVYFTY